jgi:hypothetical protein
MIREEAVGAVSVERRAFISKRSAANEAAFHANTSDTGWGEKWTDRLCQSGDCAADMGEVMGALEDLWLRTVRHPAIRLTVQADTWTGESMVLIRVAAQGLDREGCHLLGAASDMSSYQWSQGGSKGSLVSDVHWIGSTLVLELTSLHQIRRWPLGDAMVAAMQSLLQRVKQLGRCV